MFLHPVGEEEGEGKDIGMLLGGRACSVYSKSSLFNFNPHTCPWVMHVSFSATLFPVLYCASL